MGEIERSTIEWNLGQEEDYFTFYDSELLFPVVEMAAGVFVKTPQPGRLSGCSNSIHSTAVICQSLLSGSGDQVQTILKSSRLDRAWGCQQQAAHALGTRARNEDRHL